jgi:hypothetical protein
LACQRDLYLICAVWNASPGYMIYAFHGRLPSLACIVFWFKVLSFLALCDLIFLKQTFCAPYSSVTVPIYWMLGNILMCPRCVCFLVLEHLCSLTC